MLAKVDNSSLLNEKSVAFHTPEKILLSPAKMSQSVSHSLLGSNEKESSFISTK
jgi:hypothetical protein